MKGTRKLANQLPRTSFHRSMPPLHQRATSTERGDRRTRAGDSPRSITSRACLRPFRRVGNREISDELGDSVEKWPQLCSPHPQVWLSWGLRMPRAGTRWPNWGMR